MCGTGAEGEKDDEGCGCWFVPSKLSELSRGCRFLRGLSWIVAAVMCKYKYRGIGEGWFGVDGQVDRTSITPNHANHLDRSSHDTSSEVVEGVQRSLIR